MFYCMLQGEIRGVPSAGAGSMDYFTSLTELHTVH